MKKREGVQEKNIKAEKSRDSRGVNLKKGCAQEGNWCIYIYVNKGGVGAPIFQLIHVPS